MSLYPRSPTVGASAAGRVRVLALAAATILTVGCSSSGTRSSSTTPAADASVASTIRPNVNTSPIPIDSSPMVLKLVTNEPAERPGGQIVSEFVKEVAKASGGAIVIKPTFEYLNSPKEADQVSIDAARNGSADLVLARAGAWETYGVKTVQGLELPGVVSTDEQANNVARAPATAKEVLDGLSAAGVVGLGLFPENSRHVALWSGKPVSPSALSGVTFRAGDQPTVFRVLQALGATPIAQTPADFEAAVHAGVVTGTDVPFNLVNLLVPGLDAKGASLTGNFTLYTKFSILAMSAKAQKRLGAAGIATLQAAADKVLEETVATRKREDEILKLACAAGVRIVNATPDDIAGVLKASQPVIDSVVNDPVAGPVLRSIREAAGSATPPPGQVCAGAATYTPLVPQAGALPSGRYRFTVTDKMLSDANVPKSNWVENRGVFTYTIKRDGTFTFTLDPEPPPADLLFQRSGVYHVEGNQVQFEFHLVGDIDSPGVVTLTWTVNRKGGLIFSLVSSPEKFKEIALADLASATWDRIGKA
jgi:TRAP-type C4-dicarboxylate transport system substrate-binding protein